MKKSMLLTTMVILSMIAMQIYAAEPTFSASPAKLIIAFSSKAYWDGPSQSCLPRDKGCCFHIGLTLNIFLDGQIAGEMNYNEATGLTYTFNLRTGITKRTFDELCKTGKFYLDGPGTFSEEIIRMLKLPVSYSIPAGYYAYKVSGETVTVIFK